MRVVIGILLFLCAVALLPERSSPPAAATLAIERPPLPSRHAFARQMDKVREGMTRKQVLTLLGRPDRVAHTPGFRGFVTWFYGCSGPNAVPTLGQLRFDTKGKVYMHPSGQGTPPAPSVISETELRHALCLLDQTPPLSGSVFDPLALVRVVNGLLPLGKEKALAAIEEYQRVMGWIDDRPGPYRGLDTAQGQFLVLRCLFEVEPLPAGAPRPQLDDGTPPYPATRLQGYMPPMEVGAREPPEPADPTLVPRFPLVLVDDIPLVVMFSDYGMGGVPEPVTIHVAYFRAWGRLRSRPLRPSDRPWEALAQLEASPQWLYGRRYKVRYPASYQSAYYRPDPSLWVSVRQMMERQLLRMVVALHPEVLRVRRYRIIGNGEVTDTTYKEVDASQWEQVVADLKQHPVRWDAAHNRYERTPAPAASTTASRPFADAPTDTPGEGAMEKLRQAGILVGYPPGSVPEDEKPGTGH